MSFRTSSSATRKADEALGLEAAEWLLRLNDDDADDSEEFAHPEARNQAFLDWVSKTPQHLRIFLETVETHRRMRAIDPNRLIAIESLISKRFADVIPLHTAHHRLATREKRTERERVSNFVRRRALWASAAALCMLAIGYWAINDSQGYTTAIGEQRSMKLDDGSFIYLNTNSRVEVDFSARARSIHLIRGEALFVVERDSERPFTVTVGDATVRALGTQFNVRRRAEGADVAVVEGVVQVSATDPPKRLAAGEGARVVQGRIMAPPRNGTADALAWRQRHLVFHDAPLADVAEEFNRYNRTQIRVEGDLAREMQLSGIFDADRPQALMLYAAKSDSLAVEPDGADWVIRAR